MKNFIVKFIKRIINLVSYSKTFFFNRVLRLGNSYECQKEYIDFIDYIEFKECIAGV